MRTTITTTTPLDSDTDARLPLLRPSRSFISFPARTSPGCLPRPPRPAPRLGSAYRRHQSSPNRERLPAGIQQRDLAGALAAPQLGVEGLGVALAAEHPGAVAPRLAPAHAPDDAAVALHALDAHHASSCERCARSARKLPAGSAAASTAARRAGRRARSRGRSRASTARPAQRPPRRAAARWGGLGPHTSREARTPIQASSDSPAAGRRRRVQRRNDVPVRHLSTRGRGLFGDQTPANQTSPPSDSNR